MPQMENRVKTKLRNGEIVLGMEMFIPHPRMVELLGQAGFDVMILEYEHLAINPETMEDLVRTAEIYGMTSLFRPEQTFNDLPPMQQTVKSLKLGCQIVMVPHVDTAEAVQRAVEAVKYPPLGKRGIARVDRYSWGLMADEPISEFIRESNENSMIFAILESPEAVANIDEILSVEGLDAVGFGHQDFSIAAGLATDSAPEVEEARQVIEDAARRHGKYMWSTVRNLDDIPGQIERGFQIFFLGADVVHLTRRYRELVDGVHEAVGSHRAG